MSKFKVCRHCRSVLKEGEICGCPGSRRERERREAIARDRAGDEVHIRLDKLPGRDSYKREITASSTTAAINGLAVLIKGAAELMEQPVDKVFAVLATVLFAPAEKDT